MIRYTIALTLALALSYPVAWADNMFFLKGIQELERIEYEIEMEEYELCLKWLDGYLDEETQEWVEAGCLEWMDPPPMRLKSSTPETVDYETYVFNFTQAGLPVTREAHEVAAGIKVVGEYDDKSILQVVSALPDLKTDPDYLGDSYSGLDEDIQELAMETVYEVEEEGELVRKRKKTKKWKDEGEPGVRVGEFIPHCWAGLSCR